MINSNRRSDLFFSESSHEQMHILIATLQLVFLHMCFRLGKFIEPFGQPHLQFRMVEEKL